MLAIGVPFLILIHGGSMPAKNGGSQWLIAHKSVGCSLRRMLSAFPLLQVATLVSAWVSRIQSLGFTADIVLAMELSPSEARGFAEMLTRKAREAEAGSSQQH